MAAGRHNLTRRALLGAAAGVPLTAACGPLARGHVLLHVPLPAVPLAPVPHSGRACPDGDMYEYMSPPPKARTRWTRALAGFRRAEDRLAAFRAYEASLPAAARAYPACEPLEERSGELESARLAAVRRLLRAPAPDLPALALKIALAVDEEIAFFSGGEACLAAVKADALRLCHG